ncbi:P-loop ATPase [Acinetobacter tandoii]|uniref:KAP family P-loop NTPase fold protein n=1 Tax=Acinetobacter tandoii TaxID=202954 RepID=UPI000C1FE434|nr:P-loop NTPase fold protein [Acinetobacter tandoii]PJG41898.1 P-loop ATPase [Acinetobacter tandoii]
MTDQTQLNWNRTNLDNIQTAWEGDLWDRKRLGIQLTNYVDRLNCGAVLALDARWGEGKTWFVRNWQKHLEDENHHVIYLDAFANDYLDDPFLVITSEITNVLSKDKKTKRKVKKLIDLSASVGTALLPSLPKVALTLGLHLVGAGFLGGIFQNGYENAQNEIDKLSDETSDRIKESIQEKIAGHEAEKKTLEEFKKHLAQTVENLDKPLVFIIDELDRCRPDFAIRLIERIKHFFDIPKIVFVLVMNKPQLLQSIKTYYGYDPVLSGDYLEKFVDFTVHLSTNRDEYDFEGVIRNQLFRVGELESLEHTNEFFVWALGLQLDKKLNSRELTKKINKYALLRTSDASKNLVLLSLVMGQEPYANYHIYINSVIKKINTYLCPNKEDFMRKHNLRTFGNRGVEGISESEWFQLILNYNLNIKNTFIDQLLMSYEQAKSSKEPEFHLSSILRKVSIYEFDHSNNFISNWQSYISRGL